FLDIVPEFIVHGFMDRDDNMYHINGREVWTKWEEL
ncbi:transcriptional regulator, partial [Bacillus toyonensis]